MIILSCGKKWGSDLCGRPRVALLDTQTSRWTRTWQRTWHVNAALIMSCVCCVVFSILVWLRKIKQCVLLNHRKECCVYEILWIADVMEDRRQYRQRANHVINESVNLSLIFIIKFFTNLILIFLIQFRIEHNRSKRRSGRLWTSSSLWTWKFWSISSIWQILSSDSFFALECWLEDLKIRFDGQNSDRHGKFGKKRKRSRLWSCWLDRLDVTTTNFIVSSQRRMFYRSGLDIVRLYLTHEIQINKITHLLLQNSNKKQKRQSQTKIKSFSHQCVGSSTDSFTQNFEFSLPSMLFTCCSILTKSGVLIPPSVIFARKSL